MLNRQKVATLLCTVASVAFCTTLSIPKATATTLKFVHVGSWLEEIFPGHYVEHWHWQWTTVRFWPGDLREGGKLLGLHLAQGPIAPSLPTLKSGDSTAFNNTMHPDKEGFVTKTSGGKQYQLIFDKPIELPLVRGKPTLDLSDRKIILSSPLDFDIKGQVTAFAIDDRQKYIPAGINESILDPHNVPESSATPILVTLGTIVAGWLFKHKLKQKSATLNE